jgi:hypothetical protein
MNAPNQPPRKNVFISYRVSDTAGETGRLVDVLKNYFEEDQIFMDIDKIEPGVDFTEVLSRSLDSCDVMLAIIGPRWEGTDAQGQSRIKKSDDWVHVELSTALKRNIRVVPVLVDGATLPDASDLPEDLEPLTRRQSYEISNKRWRYDTEQLTYFLQNNIGVKPKRQRLVAPQPPPQPPSSGMNIWLKVAIGVLAFIGVLGVIGLIIGEDKKQQDQSQTQPLTTTSSEEGTVATPTATTTPAATQLNLNGNWVDPDGSIVQLRQSGNRLIVHLFSGGTQLGTGTGFIDQGNVEINLTMPNLAKVVYHLQASSDIRLEGNLEATTNTGEVNTLVTWLERSNNVAE